LKGESQSSFGPILAFDDDDSGSVAVKFDSLKTLFIYSTLKKGDSNSFSERRERTRTSGNIGSGPVHELD